MTRIQKSPWSKTSFFLDIEAFILLQENWKFLRNELYWSSTWKNIFTTSKSIGKATQFLKYVEPLMQNESDSSLEEKFYLVAKLA